MKKNIKIYILITTFLLFSHVFATDSQNIKIGEAYFDSLSEAVQNANSNDAIEILDDLNEEKTIVIDKGITINGKGKTIVFNSLTSSNNVGFSISTSEKVTFENITIVTNKRGIGIDSQEHHLEVNNSIISVLQRGITINSSDTENSSIDVNNSVIEISNLSNYDEELGVSDTRGISLWEFKNSTLNVTNSIIQGFFYDINIGGGDGTTPYECENSTISAINTKFRGRSAINNWSTLNSITLKECDVIGINNFGGAYESFADIVLNKGITTINVIDTYLTNFENETGINNPNATQFMISNRYAGNTINISGNTSFIDTTNKIDTPFHIESNAEPNINISSGKFSYSVKDFLDDLHTEINDDNLYAVGLKLTNILLPETIELTLEDSKKLELSIEPENAIENVTISSSNQDIFDINEDNFLLPKSVGSAEIIVKGGDIEKRSTVKVYPKELISDSGIENLLSSENIIINDNLLETLSKSIAGNKELESKIKDEVLNGKNISISFEIDNDLTDEEKYNITDALYLVFDPEVNIAKLLNINIFVKSNDEVIGAITNLENEIEFKVNVPEELITEGRNFEIARIHENEVNILNSTYENGIITAKSDKFSPYALIYTDTKEEEVEILVNDNSTNDQIEMLQTGDSSLIFAIIFTIILFSVIFLLQLMKKKVKNKIEK